MCFDTITRESLRGSVPHIVHTPTASQTAKFVLLHRDKAELVPKCDTWDSTSYSSSNSNDTSHSNSNNDGSSAYCPCEGNAAEVFSRLIIAQVSYSNLYTLHIPWSILLKYILFHIHVPFDNYIITNK